MARNRKNGALICALFTFFSACRKPPLKVDASFLESCRRSHTPESLVADPRTRSSLLSEKTALVTYFACKAIVAKESVPCRELKGWTQDGDPIDRNCRERYYESRYIAAVLSGEANPDACRQYMENTDGCRYEEFFKTSDYPTICDGIRRVLVDEARPEEVCRDAQRRGICRDEQLDFLHCREGLRFAQGDPGRCARVGIDQYPTKNGMGFQLLERSCFDHASLVRALKARNPEACGKSSFCRAAMGAGAKSCREDGDRLVETYCFQQLERTRPRERLRP